MRWLGSFMNIYKVQVSIVHGLLKVIPVIAYSDQEAREQAIKEYRKTYALAENVKLLAIIKERVE